MTDRQIRSIAIIGGGTAGWMAAAGLAKFLERMNVRIHLVESEEIGTVGVGQATVPSIIDFLHLLDIDEDDIVRQTRATFKLGIAYRDWTRLGNSYFHPFGPVGSGMGSVSFCAYWLKMFMEGKADRLQEYSIQAMAAQEGKFSRPVHAPGTPLNKIAYALHFDAALFARYLRRFAEARGVVRREGKVGHVSLRPEDGFIESVSLENGEIIAADMFIDCSGFHGILVEQALNTGYEDWTHWLPCNRALVVSSASAGPLPPYTRVTARDAGWQWHIPLQHCAGNGHVYCSSFTSDDAAVDTLLANLEGKPLTTPSLLRFTAGRRKKAWNKNCVALGLAAGFLDPLESKGVHLIQRGIAMLLKFFPDRNFEQADIDRYNKIFEFEFGRVRDFLLLHYAHTERRQAFWNHCRTIALPNSLQEKIDLFRSHGRILRDDTELFPTQSWQFVMVGQNIMPRSYDPIVDSLDPEKIAANLDSIRAKVRRSVEAMPSHQDFIGRHCVTDRGTLGIAPVAGTIRTIRRARVCSTSPI